MTSSLLTVVNRRISPEEALGIVRERSVASRLRGLVRHPTQPELVGPRFWPIAVVEATARSTGRRRWVERVRGAVDLVSGRIGLIDEELPVLQPMRVPEESLIPARVTKTQFSDAWHGYFRDYVDRRRKPMSPPALSVDSVERLWLEHLVLSEGDRRFLVDPVTHRAEALESFPWVARSGTFVPTR